MNKAKFLVSGFLVLGLALIAYQPAYSQQRGRRPDQRRGLGILFETLDQEVKEELIQLKKEDPEEFRAAAKKALEARKAELAGIGKMVLFETLTDKQKKQIVALRNKYQEALAKAVKERGNQLKEIKADNPEKFDQIIEEAKEKVRARIKNQKKHHPQKFEQFKKMNPEYLGKKMEWLKEKDPQLYNYIVEKAEGEYSQPSDETLE